MTIHFFTVVVVNIVIVVFLWLLIVLVNEVKLTLLYATIVVIDEFSQSYGNDDISGHHFGHYFPFPIPPISPPFVEGVFGSKNFLVKSHWGTQKSNLFTTFQTPSAIFWPPGNILDFKVSEVLQLVRRCRW